MTNIIRFRSREEWEQEKKEKMLAEWEDYLAFEEEALRMAKQKEMACLDTKKEK